MPEPFDWAVKFEMDHYLPLLYVIATRQPSYAGHSLRAGVATSAATAGASEHAIKNLMRRYIWEGSLFPANAAAGAGLKLTVAWARNHGSQHMIRGY